MRIPFETVAESLSTRLAAWICSRVDDSRREWALAMSTELAAIDGGWRKLHWAVSGLPLAWSLGRWGEFGRESRARRAQMNDLVPPVPRSSLDSFVLNIATLVAWWMLLALVIYTLFPKGLSSARIGEPTILAACIVGALASLAIRRNGAAYVLAGFVAFGAVELGFHILFGFQTVQGGPAHFADMASGILAVTFSALALRQGIGYRAHFLLALTAFVTSEVSIRAVYGWIWYLSGYGWRVRHLFLDGKTNYAIAMCALFGAALGVAIGKWGDHLAIPRLRRHPAERPA